MTVFIYFCTSHIHVELGNVPCQICFHQQKKQHRIVD